MVGLPERLRQRNEPRDVKKRKFVSSFFRQTKSHREQRCAATSSGTILTLASGPSRAAQADAKSRRLDCAFIFVIAEFKLPDGWGYF